jgi:carbon-monoxide dehydrogenase large subunit
LKEKIVRAAVHLLEAAAEDIDTADGRVFVVGTDRSMSFREFAKAAYSQMGRLPPDAREELEVTKLYDPVFGTTSSATHIAVLECKFAINSDPLRVGNRVQSRPL